MAFILCLFITALNFKVSKLTTVDTRISESLLTGVTGRSKCMAIHKWRMCTSRTSDNTKVPDFSFFDLRQIKTWKTEQLAWHWRYWSSFPSASEVRHMYKIYSGRWFGWGVLFFNLNIFTLNDVNVWAGITRYFGEKQRIIIESYSTVHTTLCNIMLSKEYF